MNKLKLFNKIVSGLDIEAKRKKEKKPIDCPELNQRNVKGELIRDRSDLLDKLPKGGKIAEIGVANGDFSKKILEKCQPEKLILIDLWKFKRYDEDMLEEVKRKFESKIEEGKIEIVRKDSKEALKDFKDNYFDWVYIDTDHSYETTREELKLSEEKVKDEGLIAGHDYARSNSKIESRYGVIPAVKEFCVKNNWRLNFLTLEHNINPSFVLEKIE
ncbi:class I SAM-dependent methyltransferase [Nanohaloarchaea archaeon H01]|nr:class I SAM-dependent methyltransferase [Nanohaloarchaea archaeon H01]